ncbi:MAG: DUF4292 domain-containing protein [Polyangiales bacterium]|nr:DUF4292 domain-containing protein [Myxococcales bacterium]
MRVVAAFVAVLSFECLSGCGGATCPTTLHTDAAALVDAHVAGRAKVTTLRAEARVEQWGKKGRVRGTVLMFLERPNKVRFDAMTQFGPAAVLTSDGERFALLDMRENRYLEGPTCPLNIERLLGIPLSGEDVARLLVGDVPSGGTPRAVTCTGDGTYRVTADFADGQRAKYDFAVPDADLDAPPAKQRTRLVRADVYDARGKLVWRATYDDYASVRIGDGGAVVLPFRVRVEHPSRGADTRIRFQKIDIGVKPPDGAFAQSPRPGLAVEEVVCEP